MDQTKVKHYINLLRDRDTVAEALDIAAANQRQFRGLSQNWPGSEKHKAQWEEQQKTRPVEDRMSYGTYLARDVVRLGRQEKQASDQVVEFKKELTHCETQLASFVKDNPDIGVLSLEAALNIVGVDPSADVTPAARLADAAASEMQNKEKVEKVASSKS